MSYTFTHGLSLGSSKTGIPDLQAQLIDTTGANIGSAVTTGFVETGSGGYIWTYTGFPDGFRGGIKFSTVSSPATILASISVNPEEGENLDIKLSTLQTNIIQSKDISILVSNSPDEVEITTGVI